MMAHLNPRNTPHHRLITRPAMLRVLASLLEGYEYAEDLRVSVWDFPVPLETLLDTGASVNALRWLVRRGYAACSPLEGKERGLPIRPFPRASHFTLTDAGASLLRALPSAGFQAGTESPAEPNRTEERPVLPCWDPNVGELHFRGLLVKRFQNAASNQRTILNELQRRGWPPQIVDPLPPEDDINRKHRLHDTIKNLNRGHSHHLMRFHGADAGLAVGWRAVVPRQEHPELCAQPAQPILLPACHPAPEP
jgi:hypothetical protein